MSQERINEIGLPELDIDPIYKGGNLYLEQEIHDDFNYTGYVINPTDENCESKIIEKIREDILDSAWHSCFYEPFWQDYLKTNSFSVNIIEKIF